MHRLTVALLAAFDALLAVAVGAAVVLAPLTVLWVVGFHAADWSALWPAAASVWQLGQLVALPVHLPALYLTAAGISTDAATFVISLAPLVLTAVTVVLATRSGLRGGRSGRWVLAPVSGTVVFAGVAAVIAFTARNSIVQPVLWQAVLVPALVFALPCAAGAVAGAWNSDRGDRGEEDAIERLRVRIAELPRGWRDMPALTLRAGAIAIVTIAGAGALLVTAGLIVRGGQIIALYQAANLDAAGVVLVSLAQVLYLPTLIVWAVAFMAGPGVAVGTATAVSPAGTQLGVVPGIPVLGILPESSSAWMLLLVLVPVAAGVVAGIAIRARMLSHWRTQTFGVRAAVAGGVAVLTAAAVALAAYLAGGSIGPARLADVGPHAGQVALAVCIEVLAGVGIVLMSPAAQPATVSASTSRAARASAQRVAAPVAQEADPPDTAPPDTVPPGAADPTAADSSSASAPDDVDTIPLEPGFLGGGHPDE